MSDKEQPWAPGRTSDLPEAEPQAASGPGLETGTPEPHRRPPNLEAAPMDFQPYDEKEPSADRRYTPSRFILLHLLWAALAVVLLGLTADLVLKSSGYRAEGGITALVWLILIVFLWKTISFEAKIGITVVAIGLLLALPYLPPTSGEIPPPWDMTSAFIWPLSMAMALAAVLAGLWFLWGRRVWLSIVLSLLVAYCAVAPVWAFFSQQTGLDQVLLGPEALAGWPIYIRPGYLAAEVVLPLGAVLLLLLQVRTLASRRHRTHFGYLFWAAFLLLMTVTGLSALGRQGQPVLVTFSRMVAPGLETPAPTLQTNRLKPGEAQPGPTTPETATPSTESEEGEPSADQTEQGTSLAPPTPSPEEPGQTPSVESRLEALEREVQELRQRVRAQEDLLQSLEPERFPKTPPEAPPSRPAPRSPTGPGPTTSNSYNHT
jgi:hypothetical protein